MTGRFRGKRVGLLAGGLSSEREVSLNTAKSMREGLESLGSYEIVWIDAGRDLPRVLVAERIDVVLIGLHGTWAEDGRLQGLLDWMGLPYTGSGARASLLAFDKVLAKQVLRAAAVPLAPDVVWPAAEAAARGPEDLPFGLPAVVKPAAEGSSVGVTIVREAAAFGPAVRQAAALGDVLVERFVAGPECSVAVLDGEVLGSVEIEPLRAFYDYEAKYGQAGTRYHVPPRVAPAVRAAIEDAGLAAHRALGCRGATRVDVMLDAAPDGAVRPVVLEVNTLPGMTATSLVPKIAAGVGIGFPALLERILDGAACGPEGERHGA